MDDEALLALVALSELPRVGERTLVRIQQLADWNGLSLASLLRLPPERLAEEYRVPRQAVRRLTERGDRHLTSCRHILATLRQAQARITWPGDEIYPRRLSERTGQAPPLLYLYGNVGALGERTLAILNSRSVTEHAVTATLQVARRAAADGFTLITGGMKTTHRIAAVATRATGSRRAVVLDRGLFAAFGNDLSRDPFGFGPQRSHFDRLTSVAVSPFRPYDHATPRNGRRRDEIIAALADLVVAVSARPGGEIERICLQALDRGQCVLSWQGANDGLVAAGATPLDEADLARGLGRFLQTPRRRINAGSGRSRTG
jgi:predicted Rossmann fold nucleotide-binding protein DprA/Smf involved in DNA uptake